MAASKGDVERNESMSVSPENESEEQQLAIIKKILAPVNLHIQSIAQEVASQQPLQNNLSRLFKECCDNVEKYYQKTGNLSNINLCNIDAITEEAHKKFEDDKQRQNILTKTDDVRNAIPKEIKGRLAFFVKRLEFCDKFLKDIAAQLNNWKMKDTKQMPAIELEAHQKKLKTILDGWLKIFIEPLRSKVAVSESLCKSHRDLLDLFDKVIPLVFSEWDDLFKKTNVQDTSLMQGDEHALVKDRKNSLDSQTVPVNRAFILKEIFLKRPDRINKFIFLLTEKWMEQLEKEAHYWLNFLKESKPECQSQQLAKDIQGLFVWVQKQHFYQVASPEIRNEAKKFLDDKRLDPLDFLMDLGSHLRLESKKSEKKDNEETKKLIDRFLAAVYRCHEKKKEFLENKLELEHVGSYEIIENFLKGLDVHRKIFSEFPTLNERLEMGKQAFALECKEKSEKYLEFLNSCLRQEYESIHAWLKEITDVSERDLLLTLLENLRKSASEIKNYAPSLQMVKEIETTYKHYQDLSKEEENSKKTLLELLGEVEGNNLFKAGLGSLTLNKEIQERAQALELLNSNPKQERETLERLTKDLEEQETKHKNLANNTEEEKKKYDESLAEIQKLKLSVDTHTTVLQKINNAERELNRLKEKLRTVEENFLKTAWGKKQEVDQKQKLELERIVQGIKLQHQEQIAAIKIDQRLTELSGHSKKLKEIEDRYTQSKASLKEKKGKATDTRSRAEKVAEKLGLRKACLQKKNDCEETLNSEILKLTGLQQAQQKTAAIQAEIQQHEEKIARLKQDLGNFTNELKEMPEEKEWEELCGEVKALDVEIEELDKENHNLEKKLEQQKADEKALKVAFEEDKNRVHILTNEQEKEVRLAKQNYLESNLSKKNGFFMAYFKSHEKRAQEFQKFKIKLEKDWGIEKLSTQEKMHAENKNTSESKLRQFEVRLKQLVENLSAVSLVADSNLNRKPQDKAFHTVFLSYKRERFDLFCELLNLGEELYALNQKLHFKSVLLEQLKRQETKSLGSRTLNHDSKEKKETQECRQPLILGDSSSSSSSVNYLNSSASTSSTNTTLNRDNENMSDILKAAERIFFSEGVGSLELFKDVLKIQISNNQQAVERMQQIKKILKMSFENACSFSETSIILSTAKELSDPLEIIIKSRLEEAQKEGTYLEFILQNLQFNIQAQESYMLPEQEEIFFKNAFENLLSEWQEEIELGVLEQYQKMKEKRTRLEKKIAKKQENLLALANNPRTAELQEEISKELTKELTKELKMREELEEYRRAIEVKLYDFKEKIYTLFGLNFERGRKNKGSMKNGVGSLISSNTTKLPASSVASSSSSSRIPGHLVGQSQAENPHASAAPLALNFGPDAQPITGSYPLESSWNQNKVFSTTSLVDQQLVLGYSIDLLQSLAILFKKKIFSDKIYKILVEIKSAKDVNKEHPLFVELCNLIQTIELELDLDVFNFIDEKIRQIIEGFEEIEIKNDLKLILKLGKKPIKNEKQTPDLEKLHQYQAAYDIFKDHVQEFCKKLESSPLSRQLKYAKQVLADFSDLVSTKPLYGFLQGFEILYKNLQSFRENLDKQLKKHALILETIKLNPEDSSFSAVAANNNFSMSDLKQRKEYEGTEVLNLYIGSPKGRDATGLFDDSIEQAKGIEKYTQNHRRILARRRLYFAYQEPSHNLLKLPGEMLEDCINGLEHQAHTFFQKLRSQYQEQSEKFIKEHQGSCSAALERDSNFLLYMHLQNSIMRRLNLPKTEDTEIEKSSTPLHK